jgi:nitroreductase
MKPLLSSDLLQALEWRYATKVFDADRKLTAETWETLQKALVLSPSSYGLQPYHFLIVKDPAKRAEMVPHSWGQKQVVDASHFVVFAARTTLSKADVEKFIELTAHQRGIPANALKGYRDMIIGDLVEGPRSAVVQQWGTCQAYIALGNLLTCAALLGVDACPMEGFVPAEYNRILGLAGSGYTAVVACALGYRASDDKYAGLKKVRFDASELVKTI